jgi:molybdate transport system substrate-binding protein
MDGKGNYYIVPLKQYEPIEQTCVLIKRTAVNTEAARFKKFVLSAETKPFWDKWGYTVPAK